MIRPLLHVTAIAVNSYAIWYDQNYMDLPFPAEGYKDLPFKARFAFATFWCLYIQTFYFGIALLNDFFGSNEASPRKTPFIRTLRDLLYSLAFPSALFVSIVFWSIYLYRKELVFPDFVAEIVPVWGNMVMHVTNSLFILAEIPVSRITYPSLKVGLGLELVTHSAYIFCLVKIRLMTGAWIYPLFDVLDIPKTVILFTVSVFVGLFCYFLGQFLCNLSNKLGSGKSKKKTE